MAVYIVEIFTKAYNTSTWLIATIYYGIKEVVVPMVKAGIRKIIGSDRSDQPDDSDQPESRALQDPQVQINCFNFN